MTIRKLFPILSTFFLLFGVAATSLAANMTIGEAINKAGRQRMLTQRMVKAYCQLGQDVRYLVAEKQLKDSVALFERQLAELKAFNKDTETRRALNLVEQLWAPVKATVTGDVQKAKAEKLREDAEKLLVAAHQAVMLFEEQSGTNTGRLVNISGRQRMLSQRMASLYMLMSWGFDPNKYSADYTKAVKEFEGALADLKGARENTPEIDDKLKLVSQNWDMFKLSFRMDSGQYVPGLVIRMLDKILEQMNTITGLYAALPNK